MCSFMDNEDIICKYVSIFGYAVNVWGKVHIAPYMATMFCRDWTTISPCTEKYLKHYNHYYADIVGVKKLPFPFGFGLSPS